VVKICVACHYVNAGGFRCVECGGKLIHTSDAAAKDLPDSVWRTQRVDYGARRGMLMRFIGIFAGVIVGAYGLRESVALERPWSLVGAALAVLAGTLVWWIIHRAATRGVRVWVLAKGKVRRGRLARAVFLSLLPSLRRSGRPRPVRPKLSA
jgi:hypothetical protein